MYSISSFGAMINDQVRVDAYFSAMRKVIRPDSVVVDIGTGTGIMALLACRLGARRVFAIEPDNAIQVAREAAAANACTDRIHFFQQLSTQVELPELADVIVSDIGGTLPWFRHHIPSIIDARQRFLAPAGIMIPQHDTGFVSIVDSPALYRRCDTPWENNRYGLDLRSGKRLMVNSLAWGEASPQEFLAKSQIWSTLDYTTVSSTSVSGTMRFPVTRPGTGHGFTAWFERNLVDGITISGAPYAPESTRANIYSNLFFPWSEPVSLELEDEVTITLKANLVGEEYCWTWETRVCNPQAPDVPKAHFRQSTFFAQPLTPSSLLRRERNYVATLNESGCIDQFVLSKMDGQRSLAEIAQGLVDRFPDRFKRWHAALTHVADLAERYTD